MDSLWQRVKPFLRRAAPFVLLFAFATGVIVLMDLLPGGFAIIPPLVLAIAVLARLTDQYGWADGFPTLVATAAHAGARLTRWLGAVIVPLLALLGINWFVAKAGGRPQPAIGMVIAGLLMGAAAWVYLQRWWAEPPSRHPGWWALGVAGGLVVLAIGAGIYQWATREDPAHNDAAVSELELVVIGGGPAFPETTRPSDDTGWKIHRYVGRADGDSVAWRDGKAPPKLPAHDRVLLLDVDPDATGADAPLDNDVARWAAVARAAGRADATTFALLRRDAPGRVEDWRTRFNLESETRPGDVVLLTDANTQRGMSDLALRLVARAPTADTDLALAAQHRPVLLFDGEERTATPLNVDRLIEGGLFRLCRTRQLVVRNCSNVDESSDLRNGSNFLQFSTDKLAEHTDDPTIYVHVSEHGGLKYLDYWWYLPDNPSSDAGGALCGAGLVTAGVTCHEHQSDWEGVTVIVDPDSASPSPVAVTYSGHENKTRYSWPALERIWSGGATAAVLRRHELEPTARPVVFVARGSHAAYPDACLDDRCPKEFQNRNEHAHDGRKRWPTKSEAECPSLCLTALPTYQRGEKPARWNAYNGRWGTPRCQLLVFCTSTEPPKSPGNQPRYEMPWCAKVAVVPAARRDDVMRAKPDNPSGCRF